MQVGGFYLRDALAPAEEYRIFNTWLGDPLRAAQLEVVCELMERDNLLARVQDTGAHLLGSLEALQDRFPTVLSQARGVGTFCAIDVRDASTRDRFVGAMRQRGVETGGLPIDILAPTPVSDVDLLRVHTADYLRAIATGEPLALAQSQKFPRSSGLAEAARCSPAGTRRTPRRWSRSI